MSLPVTSLIPTVIELISFWQNNWPNVFWYPNWYLGVPMRFLIGPVVPILILGLSHIVPFSISTLYLGIILISWLISGMGWWLFLKHLGTGRGMCLISCLLLYILPLSIFALTTGTGMGHLTLSMLPFILLAWHLHLSNNRRGFLFLTTGLIVFSLLISTDSILACILGLTVITAIEIPLQKMVQEFIKLGLVLITAIVFATAWYSPVFWWTILTNPSFGGKPLFAVIQLLFQLAQGLVPVILAFWAIKRKHLVNTKAGKFIVLFGSSYLFLTIIRFLSDIDFWIDWTAYALELQIIFAMGMGAFIVRYRFKYITVLFCSAILIVADIVLIRIWFLNSNTKNYKDSIIKLVDGVDNTISPVRFFLSGSPVFWLIHPQVRGGRDEVSTHTTWNMGAYNIREGEDAQLCELWLKAFGVRYLLVHDQQSVEFFKDYKNPKRFGRFNQIAAGEGNSLYKLDAYIGRIADKSLLNIHPPRDGNDSQTLKNYVQTFTRPVRINADYPQKLKINLDGKLTENEIISLAMAYDRNWKLADGKGNLHKDAFGNLAVQLIEGSNEITLEYKESLTGSAVSLFFGFLGLVLLYQSERLIRFFHLKLPYLSMSKKNEEVEY